MEQKPAGDNPGDAQKQPEIILPTPATGGAEPAPNKVCPGCGTVNPPASVYCYKCGLQLSDKVGSGYETTKKNAGFWVRFVAFIIDGILLYILISIIVAIIYSSIYGSSSYTSLLSDLESSGLIPASLLWQFLWISFLTGLIVEIIYFTISIGKWGRTVGKAALKLKVLKPDGSRVSYGRAFGRSLAYFLNGFTFGLTFLIIAFTDKKRGLHDYIADTIVIKTD